MRKEVKLGLAIGGVLLSVLIVYVLVVSGGGDKPEPVTLVTTDPSAPAEKPADKPADPAPPTETKTEAPAAADASKPADSKPADSKPKDPFENVVAEADTKADQSPWAGGVLQTGLTQMLSTSAKTPEEPTKPLIVPAEANAPTPDHSRTGAGTVSNMPASIDTPSSANRQTQPRQSSPTSYTIKTGDSFYTIAQEVYGNSSYFAHLVRANPNVDAKRLRPGTVINVPPIDQVRADRVVPAPQSSATGKFDPRTEYKVQEGDNLFRIATKLYGKSDRADHLYDLNRGLIGSDPGKLKVGTILKLPEAPTVKAQ